MNKNIVSEISVIVILSLTIILAHVVPTIAHSLEKTTPQDAVVVDDTPPTNIKSKKKVDRKYYDILTPNQLKNIDEELKKSKEIDTPRGISRHGDFGATILENKQLLEKIENMIQWDSKHIIHFVKAENNHFLESSKLIMLHNIRGTIKEVKSIWYLFINSQWKFDNKWIFKDIDTSVYYAPEDNTIVEFDKNCNYEWSPLISQTAKYFIVIYNLVS